jgi:hypothetical protein
MQYLNDKQHYSDLYDKGTVEQCRWHEKASLEGPMKKYKGKKLTPEFRKAFAELSIYFITGERFRNKEKTIEKWMAEDKKRDEKLAKTPVPQKIFCDKCFQRMTVDDKDLEYGFDGKPDRIKFYFVCKPCKEIKFIYEDGEEHKVTPRICPTCKVGLKDIDKREAKKLIFIHVCPNCDYEEKVEIDLVHKEEKPDPKFEYDKNRFCLSDAEGYEYIRQSDLMNQLSDDFKEKDQNKELYDTMARIKKLTIAELQALLDPLLLKEKYLHFELGKPEIGRELIVSFSVQDGSTKRQERDSKAQLRKLMESALTETNWKIMYDGVRYKLGFLTGRLKGVESEEDIKEIAKNILQPYKY